MRAKGREFSYKREEIYGNTGNLMDIKQEKHTIGQKKAASLLCWWLSCGTYVMDESVLH